MGQRAGDRLGLRGGVGDPAGRVHAAEGGGDAAARGLDAGQGS